MTREICPLVLDDLSDVGRFLIAGFHAAPDADFAAPEVLRWKYLEPRGEDDQMPRSYLARGEAGRVIGHVGICRTAFEGDAIPSGRIATLHMIDWLGSAEHHSIGASLMRRAHESAPTQFALGGSESGRTVAKGGGYELRELVPVYQRVLRPCALVPGSDTRLGREGIATGPRSGTKGAVARSVGANPGRAPQS